MKRVIIISAFNEEPRLKQLLSILPSIASCLNADLQLTGSNGSTDKTEEVFSPFGVIHYHDKGGKAPALAAALKKAFYSEAGYEQFITMDGDGQHDPKYLRDLVEKLGIGEVVLGSRYHYLSPVVGQIPLDRAMLNSAVRDWFRQLTGRHLSDPLCGFRAFSRKAVEWLLQQPYVTLELDGYGFELETALRLIASGRFEVIEVPHPAIYAGLNGKEEIYDPQYFEPRLERIRMHARHFYIVAQALNLKFQPLISPSF